MLVITITTCMQCWLVAQFLGVIDVLQRQLGILHPNVPVAGGSAGALAIM